MIRTRAIRWSIVALAVAVTGVARASVIEFTPSSPSPNTTATANSGAYGSDANVSVGYSPYIYNYTSGYGTLDSGTGDGIYSDNYNSVTGSYDLTMTFTAQAGYAVTLNSFELATFDALAESVNISVTGGGTAYSLSSNSPSTTTFTTYSPNETGTTLVLTVTNLYDVGLNSISFSETPVASAPEPAALPLAIAGSLVLLVAGKRRRVRENQATAA